MPGTYLVTPVVSRLSADGMRVALTLKHVAAEHYSEYLSHENRCETITLVSVDLHLIFGFRWMPPTIGNRFDYRHSFNPACLAWWIDPGVPSYPPGFRPVGNACFRYTIAIAHTDRSHHWNDRTISL
jgi:hypothetical protein